MKYWPLSTVKNSPLMPPQFAWELYRFHMHLPSEAAFEACLAVARQTPALETEVLFIETPGAPLRQAYGRYPTAQDWDQLERAGVYKTDDGYVFLSVHPLH